MTYRDVPITTEKCPGCYAEVPLGTPICPRCGGPVEIARFAELELKVKPNVRKARTFLGIVAGLQVLGLAMRAAEVSEGSTFELALSAAFYGGCFLVAFKKPLGAPIAAMAMFLFGQAAALGMGNGLAFFQGFILKVVFLVLIASGIQAGYRVRDLQGRWRKRDRTIGMAVLAGSAAAGFVLGLAMHLR